MRYYLGPLVDGSIPSVRAIKAVFAILFLPMLMARNLFIKDWEKRISVFTVMQDLDNHINLSYTRRWWSPFKTLRSGRNPGMKRLATCRLLIRLPVSLRKCPVVNL